MIKKYKLRPRSFIKNHPFAARILIILGTPVAPLIIAGFIVWNEWWDFKSSITEWVVVAFSPWEFEE